MTLLGSTQLSSARLPARRDTEMIRWHGAFLASRRVAFRQLPSPLWFGQNRKMFSSAFTNEKVSVCRVFHFSDMVGNEWVAESDKTKAVKPHPTQTRLPPSTYVKLI